VFRLLSDPLVFSARDSSASRGVLILRRKTPVFSAAPGFSFTVILAPARKQGAPSRFPVDFFLPLAGSLPVFTHRPERAPGFSVQIPSCRSIFCSRSQHSLFDSFPVRAPAARSAPPSFSRSFSTCEVLRRLAFAACSCFPARRTRRAANLLARAQLEFSRLADRVQRRKLLFSRSIFPSRGILRSGLRILGQREPGSCWSLICGHKFHFSTQIFFLTLGARKTSSCFPVTIFDFQSLIPATPQV
jgi:hypothetical protein